MQLFLLLLSNQQKKTIRSLILKSCSLLVLVFFANTIFAQQKSNANFPIFQAQSLATENTAAQGIVGQQISNFQIVTLDIQALHTYVESENQNSSFQLQINNATPLLFEIELNDMRAAFYRSIMSTDQGEVEMPWASCHTYKGIVGQDAEQITRLTIDENQIMGYFYHQGVSQFIEPLSRFMGKDTPNNQFVIYNIDNIIPVAGGHCGVSEMEELQKSVLGNLPLQNGTESAAVCLELELATDADFEWFQLYGAGSNAAILTNLNLVEGVYESTFDLSFVITFQNVFTTAADPYTIAGPPSAPILAEIRTEWDANRATVPRDLMHLFSGKNHGTLFGSVNGGGSSVCDGPVDRAHGFTADRVGAFLTTAHEIGHNMAGAHSDGQSCGTPAASIMCQGIKTLFFSAASITTIGDYIDNNNSCLSACGTVCDLSITVTPADEGCLGANDGTITVVATTSNGPVTYSISGTANQSNATGLFTGLSPGTYMVIVNDGTCIENEEMIIVGQGAPLIVDCSNVTDQDLECRSDLPPVDNTLPIVTSSCGMANVTSFTNIPGNSGCPGDPVLITRTYTITDDFTSTQCMQTFTIESPNPPVIVCPANIAVECNTDTSPAATGTATATADCAFGVMVTSADVTIPGACPQEMTIMRTWTATDDCGRTAVCTQTINVVDTTPPTAPPAPPNLVLQCANEIPNEIELTATDNCAPPITVLPSSVITKGDCPTRFLLTRTWTFNDGCGNISTSVQTIDVIDNLPISATAPPNKTVDCALNVIATPGLVEVFTPCSSTYDVIVTGTDLVAGLPNCPGTVYQVNYLATDACGRTATTAQLFFIDNEGPEFVCPADICVIDCPADTDMITQTFDAFAGLATVISSCSNLETTVVNNFNPNGFIQTNCNSGLLAFPNVTQYQVVTFTATDQCNRSTTCTALVVVTDNNGPEIEGEPYLTIRECDDNIQSQYDAWIADNIAGMTATDACSEVTWSHSPASPNEGPWINGYAITHVVFTATDACGNASSKDIHFKLKNNHPPTFIGDLPDLMAECSDPMPEFDVPNYIHACGETTLSSSDVTTPGACPNEFSVTRTWTVTDNCEGVNTTAQTIYIVDTTPPVAPDAPVDETVECADDVPPAVDLTAVDNCTGDITVGPTEMTTPGSCANQFTLVRTWTFDDGCGNVSMVSQTITVDDTTAPAEPTVPANEMVQCADDVPAPVDLTAIDNCDGELTVSPTEMTTAGTCANQYTLVRTWTFEDACGNSSSVSQTITVEDTMAPVEPLVPADETVQCADDVPAPADLTAIDNCDGALTVSPTEMTTSGACANQYTLVRTWTFEDDCGNTSSVSQTITVNDDTPPVFTFVPADIEQACGTNPTFGMPMADDNCNGIVNITSVDNMTGTGCAGSVTRTWTATDDCGNTATASQTITFSDNEPPVFTYVPATPDVNCDNIPDWEEPIAEDNCSEVSLTFVESTSGELCDEGYAWKREWTATDACGNTTVVETVIWVNPDIEGPVFTFVPEGALIDCDEFPPSFGLPQVVDACGTVSLTFEDQYVTGGPNSCANGESFDYRRVWTATDGCGNETTAKQTFWVKPNSTILGQITGHLFDENNEMIESAQVHIEGGAAWTNMMATDVEGYFEFDVPLENNYQISPQRNDNPLNGISTLDLIIISKHILGLELLDSPYKMIAADVNKSGSITAYDMIEIRKLILFITEAFPNNQSWRFVEESFVFSNPTNPFATTFPEAASINDLLASEITDFIGIKVGDVNGNAIPNQLISGDTRDDLEDLVFSVQDMNLRAGEEYTIDFKARDFTDIMGYQFTLNFDVNQLALKDLETRNLEGLSAMNFGLTRMNEGILTSSWNVSSDRIMRGEGLSVTDNEAIFGLTFTAVSDTRLSEVLRISAEATTAEAYTQDADLMNLALEFQPVVDQTTTSKFELLQNYPNPFKRATSIGFILPEASTATLTIYDLRGQTLQQIEGEFTAGYNEIEIDRSQFITSGVLYYRLDTPSRTAMKRMIMLQD